MIHNLLYERTDDASVLFNFYCGIQEMDDFIHGKLQGRIDKRDGLETYIVKEDGIVVALVSVSKSYIGVQIGNDTFNADTLEIEYLAVRKEKQREHIGKQILEWICQTILPNYPESKFLSVKAYCDNDIGYSAVPFYQSCGFKIIKKPHPMANNVKMAKRL